MKERSESDNRVVMVSITKSGKEFVRRMPVGGIQLLRKRLKELSAGELEEIQEVLEKLNLLMD